MKIDGNKLAAARSAAGITLKDLAKAGGVSTQRIWQLETDPVSNMNPLSVKAIARKLKIPVTELEAQ